MKHYSTYQSQFIEMFGSETNKVLLEDVVFVKDDCRKPINEGVRSEMKEGELYPYYGATGVVDYINDYITDEELLCVAEDCGNYNAGEESAYIIHGKAWVNNHAHLVKMKEGCDIKYLYYYLKIANLMPYVSGTTRLKLTQKKLKEIPVVLPTTDKQKAFVAIAEQADKSKFSRLKSQFIEMFGNVKDTRSLCEICRPKQWPTIPTKDFTEDGYLVYGANGVIGHYNEFNHEYPTILMACRGASCGAINISQPNSYITGNAMCMDEIIPEVSFEYLAYFLSNYDYKTIITGGAQPQITYTNLKKVMVPIPPYSEQLNFALIYQQADKSKFELRKSIDAIDAVIKSLING